MTVDCYSIGDHAVLKQKEKSPKKSSHKYRKRRTVLVLKPAQQFFRNSETSNFVNFNQSTNQSIKQTRGIWPLPMKLGVQERSLTVLWGSSPYFCQLYDQRVCLPTILNERSQANDGWEYVTSLNIYFYLSSVLTTIFFCNEYEWLNEWMEWLNWNSQGQDFKWSIKAAKPTASFDT